MCAGTLELYSKGVLSRWQPLFFQVLASPQAARLVQYPSERDHAEGRLPTCSYDLHQVEDIVEPLDAAQSWFELWFSNGEMLRLRSAAPDWQTWAGHLLFYSPKVMNRLASTLTTDAVQSAPVGTSSKQLSRTGALRSLRYYTQHDEVVGGLAAEHPAIMAVASAHDVRHAGAAAEAAPVAAPGSPAGANLSAVRAFATELSDALSSETHARSAMIEDRISHHMAELETNVKASHVGQVQTIATLASSMDVLAGGMAEAVDSLKEVNARGADTARGLAEVRMRVDAVGARVEENALRAKGENAALRAAVENVERLLLQLAPKVVAPHVGKPAVGAALRAAASGGPTPPPHHAVEALHSALTEHSSQVDEGLAHVIKQQKALDATVKSVEGAVGALSHMLADVVRAMHQLSSRQEALCQMMAVGSGGGKAQPPASAPRPPPAVAFASPSAAPPQPPSRGTPQPSLRRDGDPAGSPRSTRGFGDEEGAAALRERKAALLSELSNAAGMDLTSSHTSVFASTRLPASVKGRQDVKTILERLREVEERLAAAS